jgi:tetratricopeptide (TPR) repeat protein
VTPFVGRREELEALARALRSSRLVTVCGPAGIGKTRLVRQALLDECVVCDLSVSTTESETVFEIATALDVEPEGLGHAIDRLSRPVLLDAADRAAPALRVLLARWLASSAQARFVVTVRAPLGLQEEHELPLGPLAAADAVELFAHVARSLGHPKRSAAAERAAAERIVERLDRHPLAIEWFTPKALALGDAAALARLEDRRFDESPLAATLDESFETLEEPLCAALERIAFFERGVPASALDRVLDDPRALDRLVERGLVRIDDSSSGARATAHGPVAERAMVMAERAGRAEASMRLHARVVLEQSSEHAELEAIRRRFFDRDPELAAKAAVRLAPIEVELDAERSIALLEALVDRTRESAGAVLVALGGLERHRGRLGRARSHLIRALDAPGRHRFDALIELAHVDRQESRLEDAKRGYERALAEATDEPSEAIALGEIGRVLQSLGRFRTARDHHVRAIAIVHARGHRAREALERSLHARATHRAGEIRDAIVLHERALVMHRELGSRRLAAAELGHLGFCHHEIGDMQRAEALFRQSVEGLAEVGDVALEAIERTLLARCLSDQDRFAEARLELAIAEKATARLGIARLELTRRFVSGLAAFGEARFDDAGAELRAALELGLLHEVGFEALLPAHLALVEAGRGSERALVERSERAVGSIDNPGLAAAHAILAAGALGSEPPAVGAELVASSSDVRRALRHVAMLAPRSALALARDGRVFVLPNGTRIELGRRAAPRRLLLHLFETRLREPGRALDQDELVAAGWPNERMRREAAGKRLRTAIWTLRGFGLEGILLTRDEGYLLDPFVAARWIE